jgi:hypothetical protein
LQTPKANLPSSPFIVVFAVKFTAGEQSSAKTYKCDRLLLCGKLRKRRLVKPGDFPYHFHR